MQWQNGAKAVEESKEFCVNFMYLLGTLIFVAEWLRHASIFFGPPGFYGQLTSLYNSKKQY
jgi:hypothetical protein